MIATLAGTTRLQHVIANAAPNSVPTTVRITKAPASMAKSVADKEIMSALDLLFGHSFQQMIAIPNNSNTHNKNVGNSKEEKSTLLQNRLRIVSTENDKTVTKISDLGRLFSTFVAYP